MRSKWVIALSAVIITVGAVAAITQLRGSPDSGEADGPGGNCPITVTVDGQTWQGIKTDTPGSGPSRDFAAGTVFCVKAAAMNSGVIGAGPAWAGGTFTTGPNWSPPNADISNYVIYTLVSPTTTTADTTTPPPVESRLGLTYNQDCAPDDTNTWRIRPVDVNASVKWELINAPGTYSGTMNPGDGEFWVEAPRAQTTAILKWDSDGNGSLDKQSPKASGPDLTPESHPELFEPGAKCGPEIPPTTEPPVTTEPETTVPTTTEPETTVPTTTEPDGPDPLDLPTTTTPDVPGPLVLPDLTPPDDLELNGVPGTVTPDVPAGADGPTPLDTPGSPTLQTPVAGPRLPVTGSETWQVGLLAVGLISGGFGLRLLARRD